MLWGRGDLISTSSSYEKDGFKSNSSKLAGLEQGWAGREGWERL